MKGKLFDLTNVLLNIVIVVLLVVIMNQGQAPINVTVLPVEVQSEAVEEVAAPEQEPTLNELQGGDPFRFVIVNNQHPIVRIMMLGFFEACEDYGLDCEMAGIDGTDTAALLAQAESTISLGSSGVVFYPNEAYFEVMKDIKFPSDKKLLTVFIPSSPTPMTGYVIMLPEDEVQPLDISVDEALRFTISGGVLVPPSQQPLGADTNDVLADDTAQEPPSQEGDGKCSTVLPTGS